MKLSGSITRWNDDRGFGFVTADEGGEKAFLHVSALPRRAVRPMVGDRISYEVRLDLQGRPQAVRVTHAGTQIAVVGRSRTQGRSMPAAREGRRLPVFTMVVVATLVAVLALGRFLLHPPAHDVDGVEMQPAARALVDIPVRRDEPGLISERQTQAEPQVPVSQRFACERKTHCSQMRSCDEAMFYLNHCPGSVTDGDSDGRPCEDQWCGH